jgi:hypothetical protein
MKMAWQLVRITDASYLHGVILNFRRSHSLNSFCSHAFQYKLIRSAGWSFFLHGRLNSIVILARKHSPAMLPRSSFRAARALELPTTYAPRQSLRANCLRSKPAQPQRRCMGEFPRNYKIKPDPLEEWRNPPPSKWPNRIRLLMLPFLGAIIYSMVSTKASVADTISLTSCSGQTPTR